MDIIYNVIHNVKFDLNLADEDVTVRSIPKFDWISVEEYEAMRDEMLAQNTTRYIYRCRSPYVSDIVNWK